MRSMLLCGVSLAAVVLVGGGGSGSVVGAQARERANEPSVTLVGAAPVRLPGDVDSNSPAVWERVGGRQTLHVITSHAGAPSLAFGFSVATLARLRPVVIEPWPAGGNWMEAIVPDVDGTWYGFYHNERVADFCAGGTERTVPRIGAARSRDRGATWEDLGVILETPRRTADCDTPNLYFAGGSGDFSVMLDPEAKDLYIFYSQYVSLQRFQGVAVARLAWADRDAPAGKATVYNGRVWLPARPSVHTAAPGAPTRWIYPPAMPMFPANGSWHDEDGTVDAFWGPSVHWNTHLGQYVMLLNRAKDVRWSQEGVYVSFAPRLDDPQSWTAPRKILNGGSWYPQVLGLEPGIGTDRTAGEWARFFMAGRSVHLIRFSPG